MIQTIIYLYRELFKKLSFGIYSFISMFGYKKKKNQINIDELTLLDIVEEKEEALRTGYNNEKNFSSMKDYGKTKTSETYNNTIEYNVIFQKYAYTETDPLHLGTVIPEETFEKLSTKVIAPSLLQVYPSEYAQDSILFRLSAICSYFFVVFSFFFGELTLGFDFFYILLLTLVYIGFIVLCSHISYNVSNLLKKGGNFILQIIWYFSGTFFNPNISKYILILENIQKNIFFKLFKTLSLLFFSFVLFFIALKLYVLLTFYFNLLEYLETFLFRNLKHLDFCNSVITRGNPKLEKLSTAAFGSGDYWYLNRKFYEHKHLVREISPVGIAKPDYFLHKLMFDNDFEALNFPNKWRYLNYYTKGAYWSQKFVYTYIGKPDIWWLPAKNLAKDSILVNTHFPRIFGPFGNDISTFMMSERGLTYRYADGPAAGRLEPTVLLGRILNGSFFYDTFTQFNFKFLNVELLNMKKKMDFLLRVIPNILIYFETQLDFLSVFEFIFGSLKTQRMFDNLSLNLFFDRLENNESFQSMRLARFFNNNGSVLVGRYEQTNFENFTKFSDIKQIMGWFDYKLLLQDPMYFFKFSFNNCRDLSFQNELLLEENRFNLSPGFMNQVLKHRSFFYNFICKFSDDYSLFLLKLKEVSNYSISVMTALSKLMLYHDFFRSSASKHYEISANEPAFHFGLSEYLNARNTRLNNYKLWHLQHTSTTGFKRNALNRSWNNWYASTPKLWSKRVQTEFFKPISGIYSGLKRPANYEDNGITYFVDEKTKAFQPWKKNLTCSSKRWCRVTPSFQTVSPYWTFVPKELNVNGIGCFKKLNLKNKIGSFGINSRLINTSIFDIYKRNSCIRNGALYFPQEQHFYKVNMKPRFLPIWRQAYSMGTRQYCVARTFISNNKSDRLDFIDAVLYYGCGNKSAHANYYYCPHEYALLHAGGMEQYHPKNMINTIHRHQLWRHYPAGLEYSEFDYFENRNNVLARPFGHLVFLRHPKFSDNLVSNFFSSGIVNPKEIDISFTRNFINVFKQNKNSSMDFIFKQRLFYLISGKHEYNPKERLVKTYKFYRFYQLEPLFLHLNLKQFLKLSVVKLNDNFTQANLSNVLKTFEKNEQLGTLFCLYKNKTTFYVATHPYAFDQMFLSSVGKSMFGNMFTLRDKNFLTSDYFSQNKLYRKLSNVYYDFSEFCGNADGLYNFFEVPNLEDLIVNLRKTVLIRGLSYVENYYKFRTLYEYNNFESVKESKQAIDSFYVKQIRRFYQYYSRGQKYYSGQHYYLGPLFKDVSSSKSFLSMFRDLGDVTGYFEPYRSSSKTTMLLVETIQDFYRYVHGLRYTGFPSWMVERNTLEVFLDNSFSHVTVEKKGILNFLRYENPDYAFFKTNHELYKKNLLKTLPIQRIPISNILLDRADSRYFRDMQKWRNYKMPGGLTWAEQWLDLEIKNVINARRTGYTQGYYLQKKRYEYLYGYPSFILAEIPVHHATRLLQANINQTLAVQGGGLINMVMERLPISKNSDYFKETGNHTFTFKLAELFYSFSNKSSFLAKGNFSLRNVYLDFPNRNKNINSDVVPFFDKMVPIKYYLREKVFPTYIKLFKNKNPVMSFDCKLGFPLFWVKNFAYNLIKNGSHTEHFQQILGIELDFKLKLFLPIKQSGILPSDVEHFLLATYCWEEVLKEIEKKDFTYKFESIFSENGNLQNTNNISESFKNLEAIADHTTSKYCFDIPELADVVSRVSFNYRISGLKKETIAYISYKSDINPDTGTFRFDNIRDSEPINNYFKEQKELVEAYLNTKVAVQKVS